MSDTPPPASRPPRSPSPLSLAALAVAIAALVVAGLPYLSGRDFDGRVRAYLLSHPEVLQEVSTALQVREDNMRVETVRAQAAANPALLAPDARDPAFGPADAKVTVVEFFDFRCPGCKATAPEVLRLMQAHPDVRFVFKDWPILDQGPDGVSHYAARAAIAAHQQGKYLPVFRALMAEPSLDEPAVDGILTAAGVDLARAKADMAGPATAAHLATIATAGSALQLVGTPTFFVAGEPQASIQPADLDRAIRAAKAG